MEKRVNEEKFLADYSEAVNMLENRKVERENAINVEKQRVIDLVNNGGFNEKVQEILIAEVVAEKEKEFDIEELENRVKNFELYLEDVEVPTEPVADEHPENCECEECVAKRAQVA